MTPGTRWLSHLSLPAIQRYDRGMIDAEGREIPWTEVS